MEGEPGSVPEKPAGLIHHRTGTGPSLTSFWCGLPRCKRFCWHGHWPNRSTQKKTCRSAYSTADTAAAVAELRAAARTAAEASRAPSSVFERLSIFAGGCTLAGTAAVCADEVDELGVLALLSSLADKSLENFQTAPWCLQAAGEWRDGLRLSVALLPFWRSRGHFREARSPSAWAGGTTPARAFHDEAVVLLRAVGDTYLLVDVLDNLGVTRFERGGYRRTTAPRGKPGTPRS
jgi:hypothetical protein